MAVAIDLAASEKARQDKTPGKTAPDVHLVGPIWTIADLPGNTAFKKGKWTEAIGHYTNATIHNPDDPLGYANRAQAYLKLEKWADADRDCTTALSLPAGKGNVKALYRRALARKELGNLSGAKEDLEVLLRLEASNAVARTELAEVSSLMRKTEEQRAAKGKGRLPPSPPRSAAALPAATPSGDIARSHASTEEQSGTASALPVIRAQSSSASTIDKPPKTTAAASAPSPAASFADLRRSREGKNKKSFATSPATKPQTPPGQVQPSTVIGIDPPKLPKSALPTPDISAPGAGLQLLRSLNSSASDTWTALSLYPPDQIGRLLDGLLEPDSLGRLCVALRFGAGEGFQEQVHQILEGLKRTSRWGMNVAMLDTNEREAGQAAWSASGGEGRL